MSEPALHDGEATDDERGGWHRLKPVPRWIGVALFLYASVAALAYAKEFLVPIVLAFLLAMIFGPIRRYLDRRGLPSALSSFLIVLVLLIGFLMTLSALMVPVTGWIEKAPQIESKVSDTLGSLSHSLNGLFQANAKLEKLLHSDSPTVQEVELKGNGIASSVAWLAPGMLTQFVFTLVLLLFLLASGDMFYEKLVHVMPTFADKRRAVRIARDIERKLSRYLLTITLINAGLGCAVALAMWLIGLPSAFVFGVVAFVFNFVPYLGPLAGICVVMAVGLVAFNSIGWPLAAGGAYLALATIEGQIVTPYLVGRRLQLNTVVVFIAVSFWAWLWSAIGMIVAVPLLVAMRTFCDHIPSLAGFGNFLSERHAEDYETQEEKAEPNGTAKAAVTKTSPGE